MWLFLCFAICFYNSANSANVLFVSFAHSKSHVNSMLPMAQALSTRGHNVTMYAETYRHLGDYDGITSHYVILKMPESDPAMQSFIDVIWNRQCKPEHIVVPTAMGNNALYAAVKQESFWTIANHTWDLVISDEVFTSTGYGLALQNFEKHGTPHIVFSTTDTLHTFTTMLSLNRNPALGPSYHTELAEPLHWHSSEFGSRLNSVRYAVIEYFSLGLICEWTTRRAIEQIGYFGFTWSRYYWTSAMVYVDFPDRFSWPIANGNDLIFVGSFCVGDKSLPKDLEDFVGDPQSKGTIYVAFGSVVQWQFAPKRIIDSYVEALNNFTDYRVIWSYKGAPLAVKSHVKLLEWAPQIALLHHPNTKVFVSHGGLKSLKEAICSATPVVYMPFFADQAKSSLIAKQLGFAEYLNKMTINAQTTIERLKMVLLNNDKYQQSVAGQRAFFIDRIAHPLDEGVFWTEKVIRYGKRPVFFKRNGMRLYWFEFLYLDICGVLLFLYFFFASR